MLVLAYSAVLVVGCLEGETPVEATPPQIVVHAVLDLGSREQLVLLERSRSGARRQTSGTFLGGEEPVLGAEVNVTTPNGTVMRAVESHLVDSAAPLGLYRIALDDYGVSLVPGGTYLLQVRAPSGEVITGTTTMPRATAAAPADTELFIAAHDSLRLAWKPVDGAARHQVRLRTRFEHGCCYSVDYRVFADSTFVLSGLARTLFDDPIFLPRTYTMAVVAAVDSNYYEYYRVLSDPFIGAPPSRLRGGLGMFGAIVPVSIRTLKVQ